MLNCLKNVSCDFSAVADADRKSRQRLRYESLCVSMENAGKAGCISAVGSVPISGDAPALSGATG